MVNLVVCTIIINDVAALPASNNLSLWLTVALIHCKLEGVCLMLGRCCVVVSSTGGRRKNILIVKYHCLLLVFWTAYYLGHFADSRLLGWRCLE